ncbi:MAG: hypothetical protein CL608_30460 [Anaerolineaceae bacterium]|nr:hypothetical protein [Anaerolineaceae bacterium]
MDEEILRNALNRLRLEHIKIIYWLNRNQNNGHIATKLDTNATDIHFKRKFIEETLTIAGIEGINDSARIYPPELINLINQTVGSPPDWSKWPPPLPKEVEGEEVEKEFSAREAQTLEPEESLEESDGDNGSSDILEANSEFGTGEEQTLEPEWSEEDEEEQLETDEGLLATPPERRSQPRLLNIFSRRNVVRGILVIAFLFGLWQLILLIIGGPGPIPVGTPSPESVFEEAQSPTADSQIAVEQTLTARAPTPDAAQTQAANEAEIATNVAATETALVTDTPSPTPTQTNTPTPSPTASNTPTPSPVPPPPTDNLVLHLPLDGNADDVSGNGLNALNVNGALPTEGRHGEPNTAYSFESTSGIIIPDSPRLKGNTSAITVAVWFKTASLSTLDRKFSIITKFLNASSKDWGLLVGGNDLLSFSSENGRQNRADYTCWQQDGKVSGNEWHLGVFVADPPNLYLYLDGVLVGHCTDFEQRWIATDNNVEIGNVIYNDNLSFEGSIDDVWIWDRALSTEEILNLYLFTK